MRVLGGRTVREEMALAAMVLDETRVVDVTMALGAMKALGERVLAARRIASGRLLVSSNISLSLFPSIPTITETDGKGNR